jgi:hypothetical protein
MGYTTDFNGSFSLNKKLDDKLHAYLVKFNETRRMKRKLEDKYGIDGEFYVDGDGYAGQDRDDSIIDYNKPPITQPGLWCQWRPSDDGTFIEWDGGEKFYEYENWIVYIVQNFLAPNGYVLNGTIEFQGEDDSDFGELIMIDNVLHVSRGFKKMSEPEIFKNKGRNQVTFALDHVFEQQVLSEES